MIRKMKPRLLAAVLPALLAGLALPGLARADVRANIGAIEYDNMVTVVSVIAVSYPAEEPAAWQLESVVLTHPPGGGDPESLDPTHAEVHAFPLLGAKLWVLKFPEGLIDHASFAAGADSLSAVVRVDATTVARDAATCGPGVRRTHVSAVCK